MNRIFIASPDRDESEWLSDELKNFGRIVRVIDSLDFFLQQWESSGANVAIFFEGIIQSEESFLKLIPMIKEERPETTIMLIFARDEDEFIHKLEESVKCVSYMDLEPGSVEQLLTDTIHITEIVRDQRSTNVEFVSEIVQPTIKLEDTYAENKIDDEIDEKEEEEGEDSHQRNSLGDTAREIGRNIGSTSSKLFSLIEKKKAEIKERKQREAPLIDISEIDVEQFLPKAPSIQKTIKIPHQKLIGKILIAVGGADRRTGSTSKAIQIVSQLQKLDLDAVYVELPDIDFSPSIYNLYLQEEDSKKMPGGIHLKGIDMFSARDDQEWFNGLATEYQFIVLDIGRLMDEEGKENKYIGEFFRADVRIVTCCAAAWDFERFLELIKRLKQKNKVQDWNVIVNFSTPTMFDQIIDTFSEKEIKDFKLTFFKEPFNPDPFESSEDIEQQIQEIFKLYIPDHSRKKKGPFWRRR